MGLRILRNYPLFNLTTLKIGGPADFFVTVKNEKEAIEAIGFANLKKIPILIISGGSNIVINNSGFGGLIIHNKIKGIKKEKTTPETTTISSGAGEDWDNFVKYCIKNNWAGIECLSGIPGSVGAAPVQNIGAYGQSVDRTIKKVRAVSIKDGKIKEFSAKQCRFGYRKSIFNTSDKGKYFITKVLFRFKIGGKPQINHYNFKKKYTNMTLSKLRKEIIKIRAKKGMIIISGRKNLKSAGSFFKNPVITRDRFKKIKKMIPPSPNPWFWNNKKGIKVSAAKLIQNAGFYPGYKYGTGRVGISPKHSLALVNNKNASAKELMEFAFLIKDAVYKKFDVTLAIEPQLIGF